MTKTPQRNRPQSAKRKQGRNTASLTGNWIWGQHAVDAALANPKRRILRVLCTLNAAKRLKRSPHKIEQVDGSDLSKGLPSGAVHQGIAIQVEPLPDTSLEDVIVSGTTHIVILDQVSDPHNLGAIFRSAAAFGFTALVLQTKNAPPITGVVAKAAVGAIEDVTECRVVNIARSLDLLAEHGFHTVGLAGSGAQEISAAFKGAQKLAIVLGAEGPGLRPAVAKACAELAHIPISETMESLNVSNAASIAFYEAYRTR